MAGELAVDFYSRHSADCLLCLPIELSILANGKLARLVRSLLVKHNSVSQHIDSKLQREDNCHKEKGKAMIIQETWDSRSKNKM